MKLYHCVVVKKYFAFVLGNAFGFQFMEIPWQLGSYFCYFVS